MTKKTDCFIIDVHSHIGYSPDFHFPDVSLQKMLGIMDELGIEKSISTHTALLTNHFELGLKEARETFKKSNRRILSYLVFNPNYEDETVKMADSALKEETFVGIKIHPSFHKC